MPAWDWGSRPRKPHIHLVEPEGVWLARDRGVTIQHVVREGCLVRLVQQVRPLHERHLRKCKERFARTEVPRLIADVDALHLQAHSLRERPIFFGRKVQVRTMEALEMLSPAWRLACLANNVFQALALTMRYKPQLGLSAQPQRRVNRAQRFLLLGHPMQSIERNYEVELFAKRHAPRIRDFEPQVRL